MVTVMLENRKIIGILGGMGPMASVDMFQKFVQSTPANCDQAHIPIIISSIPDIPDRSKYLLENGEDPFPFLLKYATNLQQAGATCIVIACNTAHFWFQKLKEHLPQVHMISMIDATCNEILESKCKKIGILATNATLQTQLYKQKIEQLGLEYLQPSENNQQNVMKSIYLYKSGQVTEAIQLMRIERDRLLEQGVDTIIMGCTEVPLILAEDAKIIPKFYVDATQVLVNQAISWYNE